MSDCELVDKIPDFPIMAEIIGFLAHLGVIVCLILVIVVVVVAAWRGFLSTEEKP